MWFYCHCCFSSVYFSASYNRMCMHSAPQEGDLECVSWGTDNCEHTQLCNVLLGKVIKIRVLLKAPAEKRATHNGNITLSNHKGIKDLSIGLSELKTFISLRLPRLSTNKSLFTLQSDFNNRQKRENEMNIATSRSVINHLQ